MSFREDVETVRARLSATYDDGPGAYHAKQAIERIASSIGALICDIGYGPSPKKVKEVMNEPSPTRRHRIFAWRVVKAPPEEWEIEVTSPPEWAGAFRSRDRITWLSLVLERPLREHDSDSEDRILRNLRAVALGHLESLLRTVADAADAFVAAGDADGGLGYESSELVALREAVQAWRQRDPSRAKRSATDPSPLVDYHYDMNAAQDAGETEHPQMVIRKYAPDASDFQPESLGDCWFFRSPPLESPPTFITERARP